MVAAYLLEDKAAKEKLDGSPNGGCFFGVLITQRVVDSRESLSGRSRPLNAKMQSCNLWRRETEVKAVRESRNEQH